MHIKSIRNTQQRCYVFPKNLLPWRDSNPGLLFLNWALYPLCHAARANNITCVNTCLSMNWSNWKTSITHKILYIHTYDGTLNWLSSVSLLGELTRWAKFKTSKQVREHMHERLWIRCGSCDEKIMAKPKRGVSFLAWLTFNLINKASIKNWRFRKIWKLFRLIESWQRIQIHHFQLFSIFMRSCRNERKTLFLFLCEFIKKCLLFLLQTIAA
jgi:DNA-directed RNA polymerase subunit RPC12/RpoP